MDAGAVVQSAFETVDPDEAEPLATTAELLVTGGDGRIALTVAGRNGYGCRPTPETVAAFGSSTASSPTVSGFAAAEARRADILAALQSASPEEVFADGIARLREELLSILGLDGMAGLRTVFAASGTDLHQLVARTIDAAAPRPLLSIIGAASETGTGVPAALAGQNGEVAQVHARASDGSLRDPATLDAEVEAAVEAAVAEGRRVLLVATDVSKTGLITPSVPCVLALKRRHPHQLDVLVDACQFRLSSATLRAYLEHGLLVAATGSKFFAGPAFSGVLFAPGGATGRFQAAALPAAFGPDPNFGLLLRWSVAIEHMRTFCALPQDEVAAFLDRFQGMVAAETGRLDLHAIPAAPLDRAALGAPGGWDDRPTIFALALRRPDGGLLDSVEAGLVQRLLRTNLATDWPGADGFGPHSPLRVELGQPVTYGRPGGERAAALRLCLSAPLIVEALRDPAAAEQVLARARCALAKAVWAAGVATAERA